MTAVTPSRLLLGSLSCIFVILSYCVYVALSREDEVIYPTVRMKPVDLAEAAETINVQLDPIEAFSEIESRPLFSPSRRPPVPIVEQTVAQPETESMESAAEPLPQFAYELIGIVQSGEHGTAILRALDGSAVKRVRLGASVDGWTLQRVDAYRAVFRAGSEELALILHYAAKKSAS